MKKIFSLSILVSTLLLVACGGGNLINNETNNLEIIRIGGTAAPVDVLTETVPFLEELGFTLEIYEFDDFNLPNIALADGSIDINFFQHQPFLHNFNDVHGTDLVPVFGVYFVPLRVYEGQSYDINNIIPGATMLIPDDLTNEARALLLLQSINLIELEDGHGLSTTTNHIVSNPYEIIIMPTSAELIPSLLPDVDFAVINGNFAHLAGITYRAIDGAGEEPGTEAAITFTNYIVVRSGDENLPSVNALIEVLQREEIRQFIYNTFEGSIVPVF